MNAKLRELLQIAILQVLDANSGERFGIGAEAIKHLVSPFGFPHVPTTEVAIELEYLVEAGFAALVQKPLEPSNRTWKRTKAGRDFLSEREP